MAKQVIVLESNPADGGFINIRAAMWYPVTAGQEVPIPTLTKSAWAAASAQEVSDLQAGRVIEEVNAYKFPNSYSTATIKTELQSIYNARKAYLATVPFQGQYYGVFWDSVTGWSA
jgi:hypothetical protein